MMLFHGRKWTIGSKIRSVASTTGDADDTGYCCRFEDSAGRIAEALVVGKNVVRFSGLRDAEEHRTGTGGCSSERFNVSKVALHDFRTVANRFWHLVSVTNEQSKLLAGCQERIDDMAADVSGRSGDENRGCHRLTREVTKYS